MRYLSLLALVLLVSSCGPKQQTKKVEPNPTPAPTPSVTPKPTKDYRALKMQISDVEAREEALLDRAKALGKLYDKIQQAKASGDTISKTDVDKFNREYEDLGGLYDELLMEADDIDPDLWSKQFGSFTRQWGRYITKSMRRASFRK